VSVRAEQAEKPPHAFTAIVLRFEVTAHTLNETQLQRIVDLALNRYCTVRASLSPNINITFEAVLLNN
jgi:putative redox protein